MLKSLKKLKMLILFVMIIGVILTLLIIKPKEYKEKEIILEEESLAFYINGDNGYEKIDTVPDSGYKINQEESYCEINNEKQDVTINYDIETKTFSLSPYTEGRMKCFVYLDQYNPYLARDYILANTPMGEGTPDFSKTSCASGCDEATNGLYTAEDDYGTSYYFRGTVDNNWVKFAGFYWRIIRINGDGTIRMIYNGTTTNQTGTNTQIGTSAFNINANDNMYVGYMYTSGKVHGNETASTVKMDLLDPWYKTNITDKGFEDKISSEVGFCNDRTYMSGNGIGANQTYYKAYQRLITNKTPDFKCADSNDNLKIPVGLITADEVAYAGSVYNTNNLQYYLYTGEYNWTMSPDMFLITNHYAFVISIGGDNGRLIDYYVYATLGVRPTINLRSDIELMGLGTKDSPYRIK